MAQSAGDSDKNHPGPTAQTTECALCRTTRKSTPLTWVYSVEEGHRYYLCDGCTRAHLHSIECRLDLAVVIRRDKSGVAGESRQPVE